MDKYLGVFVFFITLNYTSSAWNHNGYDYGKIKRQGLFSGYHEENNPGLMKFFHHPHRFGHHFHHDIPMHHHMHFGLHSLHNFDHPNDKGCHFENSGGNHDSGWGSQQPENNDGLANNWGGGSQLGNSGTEESNWEPGNGNQQFGKSDNNQETTLGTIGENPNSPPPVGNSNVGNNQAQGRGQWFWNGHRWVFPDNNVVNRPEPTTTTTRRPALVNPTFTSTTSGPVSMAVLQCMRSCPVTSEYNPVCGSNNITYTNAGRLECAKNCGVDVTMSRRSACPRPTPPPETDSQITTTTPSSITPSATRPSIPTIIPTRFTTIDAFGNPDVTPVTNAPVITIPSDVLDNIFTRPTSSTTNDDDAEIDIRHEDD